MPQHPVHPHSPTSNEGEPGDLEQSGEDDGRGEVDLLKVVALPLGLFRFNECQLSQKERGTGKKMHEVSRVVVERVRDRSVALKDLFVILALAFCSLIRQHQHRHGGSAPKSRRTRDCRTTGGRSSRRACSPARARGRRWSRCFRRGSAPLGGRASRVGLWRKAGESQSWCDGWRRESAEGRTGDLAGLARFAVA